MLIWVLHQCEENSGMAISEIFVFMGTDEIGEFCKSNHYIVGYPVRFSLVTRCKARCRGSDG